MSGRSYNSRRSSVCSGCGEEIEAGDSVKQEKVILHEGCHVSDLDISVSNNFLTWAKVNKTQESPESKQRAWNRLTVDLWKIVRRAGRNQSK